jgi:hypothetical protein
MNYVYFFGGMMDGKSRPFVNDPPFILFIGGETYRLQGYCKFTWMYEFALDRAVTK